MFGNGGSSADRLNNNEQIQVSSSAELGLWKVAVTSKALLTTGNQLFSIVITSSTPGAVTMLTSSPSRAPTSKPTTRKPTSKPTTRKPTSKPTTRLPTRLPTTVAATAADAATQQSHAATPTAAQAVTSAEKTAGSSHLRASR